MDHDPDTPVHNENGNFLEPCDYCSPDMTIPPGGIATLYHEGTKRYYYAVVLAVLSDADIQAEFNAPDIGG